MKSAFVSALPFAALLLLGAQSAQAIEGDPVKGEQVFKKCMACHRIGEGAKSLVGPALTGVIGRKAGTFEGFSYSTLNHSAGENGLVWDEAKINEYLPNPNAFLKKFLTDAGKPELAVGATKMTFNLPSEQERADVIAYVKKFSPPKP